MDTSNGDHLRQRLIPGGNRQLNSVLQVMVKSFLVVYGIGVILAWVRR